MNPSVRQISGSLIRQTAALKRPSSIDLGLGEPSLLPERSHLDAAIRSAREKGLRYTPNAGDESLREAIAAHYGYPGLDRPENAIVTVGSQEAMFAALVTLLDPANDELLVVEPAFPSYAKMAALGGVAVRRVAMAERDDFAFDAERIAGALSERTRAIVLCSPCNPTGRTISSDQAFALARVLEAGGSAVTLIHDEIYREQTYAERVDLARIYPNTIAVNSLSKSNALTGLRLGWMLAPAPFVEQAVKVHAWMVSCADSFAQCVALHIFENNALGEHASWYARRLQPILETLHGSGLRFIVPEGSFYACIRLPEGVQSRDAAYALVDEHDVVTIPGVAFGDCFEGWLRLSWVAPLDRFREGLARIATFVESRTAG